MPTHFDLLCFSHLRWDWVYQRPQHLLSRAARERRVFFFEEPREGDSPRLEINHPQPGLTVAIPYLPSGLTHDESERLQRVLLADLLAQQEIHAYVSWYYTPMAMGLTSRLTPLATIYDCMDELSAFQGAPPALRGREAELLRRADLVFTGGHSLWEAKRTQHPRVYAFPSSVDVAHFRRARRARVDAVDQAAIPHPRLGYCGVIDERMDLALLASLARARPDWQLVLVGPVAKIDPANLPHADNIHYLCPKSYAALPRYLAGWDVALLPFAHNDATRFISPTKTPEYLAAGCPVVSTGIRDVVRPYGERGLVRIADTAEAFEAAVEAALGEDRARRLATVDPFLAQTSWDDTWMEMSGLITAVVQGAQAPAAVSPAAVVLRDGSTAA
jgi:glycosyltransferase involved in cell wall biosynthesis